MKTRLLAAGLGLLLPNFASAVPGDVDSLDANIVGSTVYTTVVQPDGKIIIAGSFSSVLGVSRNNIARLEPNGTLDAGFDPNPDHEIRSVVLQADGKIIIGGLFSTLQPNGAASATPRNRVARLNADGTLDAGFDPNANGEVRAVILQPDARIVLAGSFTTLQPNGAPSPTTRNRIARVNADGTLDSTFDPNADALVFSAALQPDGDIVLGGRFTTLQPNGAATPTARNFIARIRADGSLDPVFDPTTNDWVFCVAVQPDGKVLVGGQFTTLQPNGAASPTTRNRIARVDSNGTLDTDFDPNANSWVYSTVVQTDGSILLGGLFSGLSPNGAGATTVRNRIARLYSDGTLDPDFDPSASAVGRSVAIQSDGKILFGGDFTTLQPNGAVTATTRNYFARLESGTVTQLLTATDPGQILWQRGGALSEVSSVTFELSSDGGANWSMLGAGTRVGTTSDWQLTGLSLPDSGQLRARGFESGGYLNSSSGIVEQVANFNFPKIVVEQPADIVVANGGTKNFGTIVLGEPASMTFIVKNVGQANLTGLEVTKDGANAADFVITTSPMAPVAPDGSTTLVASFTPSTSGSKTCVVHIASNDTTANPFDIVLTGVALSYAEDTDNDGLNDPSELKMSALGFDWQVAQPALVEAYYSNANGAGLYTTNQVQALNVGVPLLTRDINGDFTLTLGVQKSLDAIRFDPFPITAPQTSIDGQGRIQILFTVPDNAAFFRVQAQ
ncbi:MAG: choice-of-anchor D domain-containing protein [Prosthecobacter sp.]